MWPSVEAGMFQTLALNQRESRLTQSENKTSDEVDGNRPVSDNVVYMEIETDKSSSPLHHVIRKPSLISSILVPCLLSRSI
jgi:hypothetical protein